MESLSVLLSSTTTPDQPGPVKCYCGAPIEATLARFPRPHWHYPELCADCSRAEADRQEKAEAERLASETAARLAAAIASVAPSEKARAMTFQEYKPRTESQRSALSACKSGRSVWLYGMPGVGKTHLATASAIAEVTAGRTAERHLVADLMARLRREEREDGMDASVETLRRADLLVLDDLGVERPTPLVLEALYRIIDTRCANGSRLIVTSNASPSAIARTLGARIHSRMCGSCEVIRIDGPDWRLK